MPIQHRTIGTGITQREVIDVVPLMPEDCGEIRRLADPLVFSEHPFDDLMARLEAWAEGIVQNAALPLPVHKAVCVLPDGSWRDRMPRENGSCKSALILVEERHGVDSLEWYAVQILSQLRNLRHYQTVEDWHQVVIAAYRIGCLQTEIHMKNRWEVPALSGEKSLQGATTSGEKRKDTTKSCQPRLQRDTEVLNEAKALHQQNPTYKDWKIAQCLARTKKNREVWDLSVRQLYRILRNK
jgi:hypothetical protein